MLPERERLRLATEMIETGRKLLAALKPPRDGTAVAAALATASTIASEFRSDLTSDIAEYVEAIDCTMRAASSSKNPAKDGTARALDDAVQDAHFQISGMAATTSTRSRTIYFGGGLRGVYLETPDRKVLDVELSVLCDRFGPCIVASLFQLAAGANRVLSLLHLLTLNWEHVKPDSVASDRNVHFVATSLFGYLRELTRVVDNLHVSGIGKVLSNRAPWVALKKQRKQWGKAVKGFRNDVSFHLGWPDKTVPTVERLAQKNARAIFQEGNGDGHWADAHFTGGESLLLAASGL